MTGPIAIGILLILSALGVALILTRLKFIRNNTVILVATLINPGLVGTFAGLAFIAKSLSPSLTNPLLFITIGLILISLPIIIIFLPSAMMEQMDQQSPKPSFEEGASTPEMQDENADEH